MSSLLLRNIAQTLSDGSLGTLGTDIFVEKLPENPDNAILMVSIVSPAPDQYIDTLTLDFDVWVRNQATKDATDVMDQVFNLLQRRHHQTLGDYFIYFTSALTGAENLDEDAAGRKLFKQTYRTIYRDTRTVS